MIVGPAYFPTLLALIFLQPFFLPSPIFLASSLRLAAYSGATIGYDTMLLGFKAVLLGQLGRRVEAEACLAEYLSKRKIKSVEDYRRIFVHCSLRCDLCSSARYIPRLLALRPVGTI